MRLPHRDPIQLGPTAYEVFQQKEGIPSVTGFFIEDLMDVEVKPWARMGVLGSYLNLGEQQETRRLYLRDSGRQTDRAAASYVRDARLHSQRPRRDDGVVRRRRQSRHFEWSAGAIFAIPLNVSYQHFNASNEPVRFLAGTNAPHVINLFHNEEFIFR